jgi:hypothetical protein
MTLQNLIQECNLSGVLIQLDGEAIKLRSEDCRRSAATAQNRVT